jgi:hypothetical protein
MDNHIKQQLISIIGFGMEEERAELKAEEVIKLFEENGYRKKRKRISP